MAERKEKKLSLEEIEKLHADALAEKAKNAEADRIKEEKKAADLKREKAKKVRAAYFENATRKNYKKEVLNEIGLILERREKGLKGKDIDLLDELVKKLK